MRPPVRLAAEVGEGLGRGPLLFRCLPRSTLRRPAGVRGLAAAERAVPEGEPIGRDPHGREAASTQQRLGPPIPRPYPRPQACKSGGGRERHEGLHHRRAQPAVSRAAPVANLRLHGGRLEVTCRRGKTALVESYEREMPAPAPARRPLLKPAAGVVRPVGPVPAARGEQPPEELRLVAEGAQPFQYRSRRRKGVQRY